MNWLKVLLLWSSMSLYIGCSNQQTYCNSCPSGSYYANNMCIPYIQSQCPANYIQLDSYCYYRNVQLANPCPPDYQLVQNVCYPIQKNCATPTEPPTEPPKPVTPVPEIVIPPPTYVEVPNLPPQPLEMTGCPTGSVFYEGICRKLVCEKGELYNGRCLHTVCPDGTVWRGRRCQSPNFVTTLLQIENKLVNEARYHPVNVQRTNNNNIVYHTPKPSELQQLSEPTPKPENFEMRTTTPRSPAHFPMPTKLPTTPPPAIPHTPRPSAPISAPAPSTTAKPKPPSLQEQFENGCCYIVSPRLCRMYNDKWLCQNKRHVRCNREICQTPLLYLRSPEVAYDHPTLVMPPNPPLNDCEVANCDSDVTNNVDCSGCTMMRRDSCSPFCYHYYCPAGLCQYVDMETYCAANRGEFGCRKADGCVWDFCAE